MKPDFILENIPLSVNSTLGVGGPALYFADVFNENQIFETYEFARDKQLDIFILGRGSNILFGDRGFLGVVMSMRNMKRINYTPDGFWVDSGSLVSSVVSFAEVAGLTGYENFA